MNFLDKMLEIAEQEVGCKEIRDTNKSKSGCVEALEKEFYGRVKSDPYCAIFVSVILARTCKAFKVPMPPIKTARAYNILKTARKLSGHFSVHNSPKRGDIFYMPPKHSGSSDAGSGHVGFVNKVLEGRKIETIEANTSFPDRKANGIPKKVRSWNGKFKFIRLDSLAQKKKLFIKPTSALVYTTAGAVAIGSAYAVYKLKKKK